MRVLVLFMALIVTLRAADSGSATGVVVDRESNRPLQYVTVVIKQKPAGERVASAATDAKGGFELTGLPGGDYELVYGLIGAERNESVSFRIDAQHRAVNLGRLPLTGDTTVKLEKVEVSARREAFYNSIDRKVYNVGKDVQSLSGSASDLLRNVPSVQVDIEGNVSLRGDANVLVLVNGKTSSMMGRNRAAVLEQMPADGIERIEVITNPSAKYKPDGTAGIINLVLKSKPEPGYSGSVRGSVGNAGRYSESVTASFNPGKFTFSGTAGLRNDDRTRTVQDERAHLDPATNAMVSTSQQTSEKSQPLSRIGQAGVEYKLSDDTKLGGHVNYNYRDFLRTSTVTNRSRNAAGAITGDYDRERKDPEHQEDLEFTGTLHHALAKEDHDLDFELRRGRSTEMENNYYTNIYRVPALATSFDHIMNGTVETNTEGTADYTRKLDNDAKLEAGYSGQLNRFDVDFNGSSLDPRTNTWVVNAAETNRFVFNEKVHALYATYARKIDSFGFLAGLRFEQALVDTNQITAALVDHNDYTRFYPSLHLNYDLTDTQQLQLNYSHRVHRPDGEDLNPFPKYQDPFNLRAGNPRLVPEDIHSVEAGWQYKQDETNYLATIYYRQRYHGMTEVSRYIDATTLLTTKENLGRSRAGGLELGATTRWRDRVSLNFSANVYHSEIDASNLGFSTRRSTIAWESKLNAMWDVTKQTLVQLNTNYTAKRLTPQGYRYPTYLANVGLRHNFTSHKIALIVTLSDVFSSLRERTHIDTAILHEDILRRRNSRALLVGFIYNFGKAPKKQKNDLQFDTAP